MSVKIAELNLTFGELESLEVNQILPIELFEHAEISIHDSSAFLGVVGELDGKAAVELRTTKTKDFD
jgi:flagellar motor switch protein FliM